MKDAEIAKKVQEMQASAWRGISNQIKISKKNKVKDFDVIEGLATIFQRQIDKKVQEMQASAWRGISNQIKISKKNKVKDFDVIEGLATIFQRQIDEFIKNNVEDE